MNRYSNGRRRWRRACDVLVLALGAVSAGGQATTAGPVTDSSAQASPVGGAPSPAATKVRATDASAQASPIRGVRAPAGPSIASATAVPIQLTGAIDSGRLHNGQIVAATLAGPVATTGTTVNVMGGQTSRRVPGVGSILPAGTPVVLTVVATVAAGQLTMAGELSLQVSQVGSVPVVTDVQTFQGKPGHMDLPDSAPELGTNAGLPAGATLTFTVQPPPAFDMTGATAGQDGPGSVNGEASGTQPSARAKGSSLGQPGAAPPKQP